MRRSKPVRLETAPTGPRENIALLNLLKPHETAPTVHLVDTVSNYF